MDVFLQANRKGSRRKWLRKGKKSTLVTVVDKYGPKVMMMSSMDINGICYYEYLEEKQTDNAIRYL